MVGVLILTHGGLAHELLAAARTISGELTQLEALSLDWSDSLEAAEHKVAEALERLDHGDGVLVLTDIFGGTPSNVALALRRAGSIDVVCGVNLPMVVRLGCVKNRDLSLGEMAEWIRNKGRSSICCSSDVPAARPAASPTVPRGKG